MPPGDENVRCVHAKREQPKGTTRGNP